MFNGQIRACHQWLWNAKLFLKNEKLKTRGAASTWNIYFKKRMSGYFLLLLSAASFRDHPPPSHLVPNILLCNTHPSMSSFTVVFFSPRAWQLHLQQLSLLCTLSLWCTLSNLVHHHRSWWKSSALLPPNIFPSLLNNKHKLLPVSLSELQDEENKQQI